MPVLWSVFWSSVIYWHTFSLHQSRVWAVKWWRPFSFKIKLSRSAARRCYYMEIMNHSQFLSSHFLDWDFWRTDAKHKRETEKCHVCVCLISKGLMRDIVEHISYKRYTVLLDSLHMEPPTIMSVSPDVSISVTLLVLKQWQCSSNVRTFVEIYFLTFSLKYWVSSRWKA